jgi:hypothetical protein
LKNINEFKTSHEQEINEKSGRQVVISRFKTGYKETAVRNKHKGIKIGNTLTKTQ